MYFETFYKHWFWNKKKIGIQKSLGAKSKKSEWKKTFSKSKQIQLNKEKYLIDWEKIVEQSKNKGEKNVLEPEDRKSVV